MVRGCSQGLGGSVESKIFSAKDSMIKLARL